MDIRSAQKIAWDAEPTKIINTNDVSLALGEVSGELAKAFDAWSKSRREITEELAAIAISLLRLAETAGTDLQEAIETKLAASEPTVYEETFNRVPAKQTAAEITAGMNHGKLVRDKIPEIIRSKGQEPVIYIADAEEYCIRLRDKLREEVEEYLASDNDREELADILEVLYALARQAGTDQQQLEKLRAAKAEKRGGFADRIIWFCNQQSTAAQEMRIAAVKL
jgi:predicted house-cleaning noncanonical NTP pyrophosphatase (MazG superfamily)